jgi:hypothetical protein
MDDDNKKLLERGLPTDTDIRNFLQGRGMRLSDLSCSIGIDRGIFITTGPHPGESFFIYRTDPKEDKVLSLFDEFNIPHFPRIETTPSYSVVKLPPATKPLFMFKFSEKRPTDGTYIGAFEIMALLGKFLKRLRTEIQALPQNLSIVSFALVPSEDWTVHLIPPLLTGEILPPQKLEKQFLETFNKIDPLNYHKGQVQELMRNYLL